MARGVHVEPLSNVVFGPVRPALYILLAAVGLVLLVACVNVANLLLARATARAHEVAVRSALGATQARIARQALAEALLLTFAASVVGVGLAYAGVRGLVAIAPPDVPRLGLATINLPVLATTLGVAVLVGVVFGLIPTFQARRLDLQSSLTEGSPRGTSGPGRTRLRSALVVAELAFAVVLVSGAGLLIRSFWTLQRVDPGFQTAGVLKAEYQLPAARYPIDFRKWPDFKEQHAFNAALLQRAAALPGVTSAALAGNHPLDPGFTNSFTVVGREAEARDVAGDLHPARQPGVFPHRRSRARSRPLLPRRATTPPPHPSRSSTPRRPGGSFRVASQSAASFASGDPLERLSASSPTRSSTG